LFRHPGRCRGVVGDPLGPAAVEPAGQVVDPVLLGRHGSAEVGNRGEQFPDHSLQDGDIGRQLRGIHAPFNTAVP
jgi:hypothetical protein